MNKKNKSKIRIDSQVSDYIKSILSEKHKLSIEKSAMITQDDGTVILMESCVLDGTVPVVLVSDNKRAVVVSK